MGFFSFLVLLAIAYLLWRVTDQLPDLIFRLSEIQRDVAEIRRAQPDEPAATEQPPAANTPAPSEEASASNAAAEDPAGDDSAG